MIQRVKVKEGLLRFNQGKKKQLLQKELALRVFAGEEMSDLSKVQTLSLVNKGKAQGRMYPIHYLRLAKELKLKTIDDLFEIIE